MKDKKEIKEIIHKLRKKQDEITKEMGFNIWITVDLEATTGEIMDVNPFGINLRNGTYFGRDLIDGNYKSVKFW